MSFESAKFFVIVVMKIGHVCFKFCTRLYYLVWLSFLPRRTAFM